MISNLRQGTLIFLCAALVYMSGYLTGRYWTGADEDNKGKTSYEIDLNVLNGELQQVEKVIFPEEINDFHLSRQIGGNEALELVSGFMGGELPAESCHVPYYRGNQADVVLWVVELENSFQSYEIFRTMKERLQDNASFKNERLLKLDVPEEDSVKKKPEVVHVEIKEQKNPFKYHFFYRRGNWVFWMMTEEMLEKEDLMNFYWSIPS